MNCLIMIGVDRMKVEITMEEVRRVSMEVEVTDEQLEMLESGNNIFAEEMLSELDYGFVEYDYAVCDMEGRTIVDWN